MVRTYQGMKSKYHYLKNEFSNVPLDYNFLYSTFSTDSIKHLF